MRKPATIRFWKNQLPHWEVKNGLYFVTIHLKGAVPKSALEKVRAKLALVSTQEENDYTLAYRESFLTLENYLEHAPKVSDLSEKSAATVVADAIDHYERQDKWRMISYIIMPNHIHLFFATDYPLKDILEPFKRWTGREIRRQQGKAGAFWQPEWFDHWSRSPEQDEKIKRYIKNNPKKAGLGEQFNQWPFFR